MAAKTKAKKAKPRTYWAVEMYDEEYNEWALELPDLETRRSARQTAKSILDWNGMKARVVKVAVIS